MIRALGAALAVALCVPVLVGTPHDAVALAAPPVGAPARAAAALVLDGPGRVVLGRMARVQVVGGDRGTTYRWDADNRPGYEVSTGWTPALELKPTQGGPLVVKVEARLGDGSVRTVSKRVTVARPDAAALRMVPADPQPGERVRFTMAGRSDSGGFKAFAWDVEGVAPSRTRVTVSSTGVRGNARARAAVSTALGGYVDTKAAGLEIGASNQLMVRMPAGKKATGRTIGITAYAFGNAGQVVKMHRTVTLDTALRGFGDRPKKTVDCDDPLSGAPSWPCAQVVAGSAYPIVGYPAVFYDATPAVEVCYPVTDKKPMVLKTRRTELLDLGYPVGSQFIGNVASNPITAGGGFEAHFARTSAGVSYKGQQKCEKREAQPVSWRFGDGATVKAPGDGKENLPVGHVYKKAGTFKVTLTTRVPYVDTSGKKTAPVFDGVSYFLATATITVTVTSPYCGTLKVGDIPVRSVARSNGAVGCFSVRPTLDKSHVIYQPPEGYAADVNGMQVYRELVGIDDTPIVDPTLGTITGFKDMAGYVPVTVSGTTKKLQVFEGPVLAIPPLAPDARVGRDVAALPGHDFSSGPYSARPSLSGLPVISAQALLSPTSPTVGVATLKLPAPLGGYADALTDGSTPANAPALPPGLGRPGDRVGTAGRAGPYDVQADLSGVNLGGVGLTSGVLRHRATAPGGWEADIVLDLPGLGTVNAPYRPAGGVGSRCTDTFGPSGLELTNTGGFVSGGAQLDFADSAEPVLGPLSLGCVAVKAQVAQGGQPFQLTGLAQAHVPPQGPITVDGCASFALVPVGTTSTLCGRPLLATSDQARLTATADISLYDGLLELGDGFADLTAGTGQASVQVGGSISEGVGPFSISGFVEGGASGPPVQFYLYGGVEVCAFFCGDVQAGVSTEGFGACASIGGFFYYWDERSTKFFAFSCNLKAYLFRQQEIARRNDLPVYRAGRTGVAVPRAGATSLVVPVPAGQSQVAIALHRDDTTAVAPEVTLVSPSGRVYTMPARGVTADDPENPNGDGVLVQRFEGAEVGTGITTFTVPSPEGGDWTVRADTPVTAELATPAPSSTVTGSVSLTGRQATLQYTASVVAGDTVRIIESGPQGERTLGVASGTSTLAIPTGPRGPRTVTAVVERDGVPIAVRTLGSYSAPGLAALAAPTGLTTSATSGGVVARWNAVPGATAYVVTGTLTDGRVVRRVVTSPAAALPGTSRFTGGTVRVVARVGAGRDSVGTTRTLAPVRQVRVAF